MARFTDNDDDVLVCVAGRCEGGRDGGLVFIVSFGVGAQGFFSFGYVFFLFSSLLFSYFASLVLSLWMGFFGYSSTGLTDVFFFLFPSGWGSWEESKKGIQTKERHEFYGVFLRGFFFCKAGYYDGWWLGSLYFHLHTHSFVSKRKLLAFAHATKN
jgi:hypothetical protein